MKKISPFLILIFNSFLFTFFVCLFFFILEKENIHTFSVKKGVIKLNGDIINIFRTKYSGISFFLSSLISFFLLFMYDKKYFSNLRFFKFSFLKLRYILFYILFSIVLILVSFIFPLEKNLVDIKGLNLEDIALYIIAFVIFIPIIEEYIFREYLIRLLDRYSDLQKILFSSIIFSLFHIWSNSLHTVFILFIFSTLLSYIYTKEKNIYNSLLLHSLNNLIFIITSVI
jgi:hypothetical protein